MAFYLWPIKLPEFPLWGPSGLWSVLPMAALLLVAIFTVHLPLRIQFDQLMAVTPSVASLGR